MLELILEMWFVSEGVNQISLAQSGIQWLVFANKRMNLWISEQKGIFYNCHLLGCAAVHGIW